MDETYIRNLIVKRKEYEEYVESYDLQIEQKERSLNIQVKLAEHGKENCLAFEQTGLEKLKLALNRAKKELRSTNDEIEVLKISSKHQNNTQKLQKNHNIEVWYSEYELRQFIDMATRYTIDSVFNSRTDKTPFSIFTYDVKIARENFEKFSYQLRETLTEKANWKAIEIDLNRKFLLGINQYIDWYNKNKNELKKFQPHCPYTLMLSIIESTKDEIKQYFPKHTKSTDNDNVEPQQAKTSKKRTAKNKYSQRQVAIAYWAMGKLIDKDNYQELLKKYTNTISIKILEKRIYKGTDLTNLSENKTTDTKHLNDLLAAKRLLISVKNKKGISEIKPIIKAFQTSYNFKY